MKGDGRAFWDTSAIVPLCCQQGASQTLRRLLRQTPSGVVWWGTAIEAHGALRRLVREKAIGDTGFGHASARLAMLLRSMAEVQPSDEVRELSKTMLDRFPLRSADALQLAAALAASRQRPRQRLFVCLDAALANAASAMGFTAAP